MIQASLPSLAMMDEATSISSCTYITPRAAAPTVRMTKARLALGEMTPPSPGYVSTYSPFPAGYGERSASRSAGVHGAGAPVVLIGTATNTSSTSRRRDHAEAQAATVAERRRVLNWPMTTVWLPVVRGRRTTVTTRDCTAAGACFGPCQGRLPNNAPRAAPMPSPRQTCFQADMPPRGLHPRLCLIASHTKQMLQQPASQGSCLVQLPVPLRWHSALPGLDRGKI